MASTGNLWRAAYIRRAPCKLTLPECLGTRVVNRPGFRGDWWEKKSALRALTEHPFRMIKRQFGHVKVRYRRLAKNTEQLKTLFALSNLWMVREKLRVLDGKVRPARTIAA